MANLTESLQTIYDTKIKIKAAIGTNSDIFTEYPELILNKIEEVRNGVTWEEVANAGYVFAYQTIDITNNGEYDTTYSYMVNVNVSGGTSDPTILVTPWFGGGIGDTSGENTYFRLDIGSMLDQPLLNSLQANIDAPQLPVLMGAEYILDGSSTWESANEVTNPDGPVHMWVIEDEEDPAPGGLNWLLVWVSPDIGANGYGRVKFEVEAYTDEPVTGTTNWISFDILTID